MLSEAPAGCEAAHPLGAELLVCHRPDGHDGAHAFEYGPTDADPLWFVIEWGVHR